MTHHKGFPKVFTCKDVKLSIGGKPVVFAHGAHHVLTPAIEIQRLCKVLSALGVRSARKYIPFEPFTYQVLHGSFIVKENPDSDGEGPSST